MIHGVTGRRQVLRSILMGFAPFHLLSCSTPGVQRESRFLSIYRLIWHEENQFAMQGSYQEMVKNSSTNFYTMFVGRITLPRDGQVSLADQLARALQDVYDNAKGDKREVCRRLVRNAVAEIGAVDASYAMRLQASGSALVNELEWQEWAASSPRPPSSLYVWKRRVE
ncbi:MAG TPA: hypothetical protein VGE29_18670 [Prosthecobacter sp.]